MARKDEVAQGCSQRGQARVSILLARFSINAEFFDSMDFAKLENVQN